MIGKILHLIDSISVAGAEKLLCNTISELPEYEHMVVTVFSDNDLTLLPPGTHYQSLYAKGKVDVFLKGSLYKNILIEFKPDLVHSHLYFATVLAKCFTPQRIPLAFTQHFEFSKNASRWYYRFVDKIFSNKQQTCIAVSNTVLDDYVDSTGFKGKTVIVSNYIPDKYFHIYRDNNFERTGELKLVALGNIKPIKNQQYILAAFNHLKDLNVSCDIYGEGAERDALQQKAKNSGLRLDFKGIVSDPSKVLPLYDLYVMPSLTEGFPLALFEAMAVGLPVAVSNIPVFREILDNNGNYLSLTEPAALREVIKKYLAKPDLLKKDGEEMKTMAKLKAGKEKYLLSIRNLYNCSANGPK